MITTATTPDALNKWYRTAEHNDRCIYAVEGVGQNGLSLGRMRELVGRFIAQGVEPSHDLFMMVKAADRAWKLAADGSVALVQQRNVEEGSISLIAIKNEVDKFREAIAPRKEKRVGR